MGKEIVLSKDMIPVDDSFERWKNTFVYCHFCRNTGHPDSMPQINVKRENSNSTFNSCLDCFNKFFYEEEEEILN